MKMVRSTIMAIWFRGLVSTIILALLAAGSVLPAQTTTSNSDSASPQIAPYHATAQLMEALQYDGSVEDIRSRLEADTNFKDYQN